MLPRVELQEGTDDESEAVETRRVIDLALRVGELVLSNGAGAADVSATALAVTTAGGLRGCAVDVSFTTITVSYSSRSEAAPQTFTRTVTYRGTDYGLLADVDQLVRELRDGSITRTEASSRLNTIRSTPSRYPDWLASAAAGAMAAGVAMLLQGNLLAVAGALVSALLVDQIVRMLIRWRIPVFYHQVAAGFVVTLVAHGLHELDVPVAPSLIVASGIVVRLAGITLVGAVQDALTGYYVTATARTFESLLLTGGVIAGVSLGLSAGVRLGFDLPLEAAVPTQLSDLPSALMGGTVVSVAFAVSCFGPTRALLPIAAVGLVGQAVYVPLTSAAIGVAWSSAMAAVVIGIASYSLAGRFRVPPLIIVVSGIVGLLPGLTIYRGLTELLTQDDLAGLLSLLTAMSIAIGLASGVLLGEYIAQPLKREARRLENRLAGPRLVGPRHPRLNPLQRLRRRRRRGASADTDTAAP
jgi:uncharacterized membrane protein YjjP (DUF1212 family)